MYPWRETETETDGEERLQNLSLHHPTVQCSGKSHPSPHVSLLIGDAPCSTFRTHSFSLYSKKGLEQDQGLYNTVQ